MFEGYRERAREKKRKGKKKTSTRKKQNKMETAVKQVSVYFVVVAVLFVYLKEGNIMLNHDY